VKRGRGAAGGSGGGSATAPSRLREALRAAGFPRLVIGFFLVVLFSVAIATHMDVPGLLTDSLARVARNGLLVLALLPAIRGGLGLNFGLPLGIVCGLVGCVISLNAGMKGWIGLGVAALIGLLLSVPVGWGYGAILNRTRGQEMMVGTYLGFAAVSGMSIFWLVAPFHNPQLVWAIGGIGLRTTLSLSGAYDKVLDRFLHFEVAGIGVPTGTLLVFAGFCALTALFFRTRWGITIAAARGNPRFARAAGISYTATRTQAAILSTALGAIGIVVFSQSYGFVQLYTAPLYMAFPAVACLLIGGATVFRANVFHVIVGTILFQSILTTALPVTSQVIQGDISETARLVIQNGMILYALTRRESR
jgi:simple sugar transport system permease protein